MSTLPPASSITFDRAAGYYDQTRGFPPGIDRQAAALMAQLAGISRESVIVEIGVGTGRIALPLAQLSGPYTGIDLSAAMMSAIGQKRADYPRADLRLIRGDVQRLPLKSDCADFAVLVHILHLIPDPFAAAAELARVLKPGGAAITGWNRHHEPALRLLHDAWGEATGNPFRFDMPDTGPVTLNAAGWTLRTEGKIEYTATTTAHERAETYRQRIFSHMWRMPDETWRAGVEAVEAALTAHFPDPHAPQQVIHTFNVAVYAPQ